MTHYSHVPACDLCLHRPLLSENLLFSALSPWLPLMLTTSSSYTFAMLPCSLSSSSSSRSHLEMLLF